MSSKTSPSSGGVLVENLALPEKRERAIMPYTTGRGAVRLARLHGVQEVGGSIPPAPTEDHMPSTGTPACGLWFLIFEE